jgi:dATP pyrophosphohydrolase
MEFRTTQVEIIVFKIVNKQILFLLLKRNLLRGDFWQPVTGGVHENEPLPEAAQRELKEETGITDYLNIYNDVYYFEFQSEGYGILKEYVFGVKITPETTIQLSSEHTDMKWCNLGEALSLLKYESNRVAFQKLYSLIENQLV